MAKIESVGTRSGFGTRGRFPRDEQLMNDFDRHVTRMQMGQAESLIALIAERLRVNGAPVEHEVRAVQAAVNDLMSAIERGNVDREDP